MSGPAVMVPVDWLDSDALEDLGADVAMLMLTALGWSARHLTEGVVPKRALRKLWPVSDLDEAIRCLSDAGEVESTDSGLYFVNWQDFLMPADEVERKLIYNRIRDRRRRRHNNGDHSTCVPSRCRFAPDVNTYENTRPLLLGETGPTRETTRETTPISRVSHAVPTLTCPDLTDPDVVRGSVRKEGEGARSAGATRDPRHEGDTRGSQVPPPPPDDPEQRLGRKRHQQGPDCCGLPAQHPIHQVAS